MGNFQKNKIIYFVYEEKEIRRKMKNPKNHCSFATSKIVILQKTVNTKVVGFEKC